MRIVCDLATAAILQVEKTPQVGDARPFNGRFVVPIPEMAAVEVTKDSYVLPVDGGDVMSLAMQGMLIQYPMYNHIVFNPFLDAADFDEMDVAATFTPTGDITRCFGGRGTGVLPAGIVPNAVGVMAQNTRISPSRPGLLVSDAISISAATSGVGADEFLVWWKLYAMSTDQDVSSEYGATAGVNAPAIRSLVEVDDEPAGFQVWLSNDNGTTYTQMNRLMPTAFAGFGTNLKIAFRNTGTSKVYVAAFAVLF